MRIYTIQIEFAFKRASKGFFNRQNPISIAHSSASCTSESCRFVSGSHIPVEWQIRRMTMELVWFLLYHQYVTAFNDFSVIRKRSNCAFRWHQYYHNPSHIDDVECIKLIWSSFDGFVIRRICHSTNLSFDGFVIRRISHSTDLSFDEYVTPWLVGNTFLVVLADLCLENTFGAPQFLLGVRVRAANPIAMPRVDDLTAKTRLKKIIK